MSDPHELYPLFLKLAGEKALVVGGGPIAAQKAGGLVRAGAEVTLVAEQVSEAARVLVDDARIFERSFAPADAAGARVVIAASDNVEVNRAVYDAAKAHGALVNVVDVPELCDFYAGAQVRRGPLRVVIGTQGAAPALARALKVAIEKWLPPEVGQLAETLESWRPDLLRQVPDYRARADGLKAALVDVVERVRAEGPSALLADVQARLGLTQDAVVPEPDPDTPGPSESFRIDMLHAQFDDDRLLAGRCRGPFGVGDIDIDGLAKAEQELILRALRAAAGEAARGSVLLVRSGRAFLVTNDAGEGRAQIQDGPSLDEALEPYLYPLLKL